MCLAVRRLRQLMGSNTSVTRFIWRNGSELPWSTTLDANDPAFSREWDQASRTPDDKTEWRLLHTILEDPNIFRPQILYQLVMLVADNGNRARPRRFPHAG